MTMSINGLYIYDPSIFEYFTLPEEMADQKQNIIDYIVQECAELEVVYPDPYIMKNSIRIWSSKNLLRWQKLYETTQFEYNPIWNKDGTIKEMYHDETTGSGNFKHNKTGYNSEESELNSEDVTETGGEADGNRTRTEQGNIGVTSTQELIERERAIWNFNMYDVICNDFKKQYCLMVW